MRNIGDSAEYSVEVFQRSDGKTWGWHILRAGRTKRAGKALPIQRSVKKYRIEEDARLEADAALAAFTAALQTAKAKRR